jgi:hypothetical protein
VESVSSNVPLFRFFLSIFPVSFSYTLSDICWICHFRNLYNILRHNRKICVWLSFTLSIGFVNSWMPLLHKLHISVSTKLFTSIQSSSFKSLKTDLPTERTSDCVVARIRDLIETEELLDNYLALCPSFVSNQQSLSGKGKSNVCVASFLFFHFVVSGQLTFCRDLHFHILSISCNNFLTPSLSLSLMYSLVSLHIQTIPKIEKFETERLLERYPKSQLKHVNLYLKNQLPLF